MCPVSNTLACALTEHYSFQQLPAIREELAAHEKNKTWEIVERRPGVKTIKSRWIFKKKRGPDGQVMRHKVRLVAKGFTQVEGVDFHETFAPVASLLLVRLLVAIACRRRLRLFQLDVKTAFLHGFLEEEIYLEPPEGLDVDRTKVCRLRKSLYGLRQGPRQWNVRFDSLLRSLGLQKSQFDDCLYFNRDQSLILLIYVDDVLVATNSPAMYHNLVKQLSEIVELSAGPISVFLGIKIDYDYERGHAELSQEAYIDRMLNTFKMQECNQVATPEEAKFEYEAAPVPDKVEVFKRLIGSLIYLATATRPDIAHAVNMASRAAIPTQSHMGLIKRTLRYLRGTKSLGIRFVHDGKGLLAFSDADFANDLPSRRSTTGSLLGTKAGLKAKINKMYQKISVDTAKKSGTGLKIVRN
jgi:hypothetical protein